MSGDRPESMILMWDGEGIAPEPAVENARAAVSRYLMGQDDVMVVPAGFRIVAPYEVQRNDLQPVVAPSQGDGCAWVATALAAVALIVAIVTLLWR